MKKTLTILLLLSFPILNSQVIFNHEREINNKENYLEREIEIINSEENIKLYGTLITPNEDFEKLIIIVPGSGKDTRNSHFILTEEFLKNKIAVFRYDERGVGKSEGLFSNVSYGISQITSDLFYIINTLKKDTSLQNKSFGMLGHSFGGMATIGVIQKGIKVDFLIQWATPVEKYGEFFKYQLISGLNTYESSLKFDNINKKLEIMDVVHKVVANNKNDNDLTLSKKIRKETKKYGYSRKNYDRFTYWGFPTKKDILRQNYEETYKSIDIPTLYIIGSNDKFVSAINNVYLLNSFNNPKIETRIFEGLNHYLRNEEIIISETKLTKEIYELNNIALSEIIKWTIEK